MFATENCIGWKVIRLQQYNGKKQFEIKLCIKLNIKIVFICLDGQISRCCL